MGMQNYTLSHMKTPKTRMEDVQKLRAMYSSSEVRRPSSKEQSKYSAFISNQPEE